MEFITFGDSTQVVSSIKADESFAALSRFTAAQKTDQIKQAFQRRRHHVDAAIGFLRMEVLSPRDAPNEIWLITYWKDESSYQN